MAVELSPIILRKECALSRQLWGQRGSSHMPLISLTRNRFKSATNDHSYQSKIKQAKKATQSLIKFDSS
jgi:hypothetical protein